MSTAPTKTCKICYMEIDSRARRCPYCHHWQRKLEMAVFSPGFSVVLGIVPLAIVFGALAWFLAELTNEGRDFQPYRDQIEVTQSEMKFSRDGSVSMVTVVGTVRNDSDIGWKEVQLEVRFFDKDHKLTDAAQDRQFSLVVPAHDESAFGIWFKPKFPQDQYASHQVRVLSAHDARARF